jgi:hypothetical protein
MAQWRLKPKHFPEPDVDVWPEHWEVLQLFSRLSTQWRTGVSGPTGLDYPVFFHELTRAGIQGEAFDDALADLRIIEIEALQQLHKENSNG